MSYNIHTVVPSGAQSRGYEFESEEKARDCFNKVKFQLADMDFEGELIMSDSGKEIQRESFSAA